MSDERMHRIVRLRADEAEYVERANANWRTCCDHLAMFHEEWDNGGLFFSKCQIKGCPCGTWNDEQKQKRKAQERYERAEDEYLLRRAQRWASVSWFCFGVAAAMLAAGALTLLGWWP